MNPKEHRTLARPQRADQRLYTLSEVEAMMKSAVTRVIPVFHKNADIENILTRIYTAVEAGIEVKSDTLITNLVQGWAGRLSKCILDFQELTQHTHYTDDNADQLMYELIEAVKQAALGKCATLIAFVEAHSAQSLQDKIRNRGTRKKRQRTPRTELIGQTMYKFVSQGKSLGEAATATRQELNLTTKGLKNVTAETYLYRWLKRGVDR